MGCGLSLALFAVAYAQHWAESPSTRHWLPWVALATGLAITFHAASDLLTTLARGIRHEDLARTRGRELAAHRDRAREVLARIRDAVVVTDPDGYVLEWNEAATRTLGRSPDEARGQHCAVAMGIRSVDRPLDCRAGCALLRGSVGSESTFGVEVLRDLDDGGTQPLLANVGVVRDDDGVVEIVHSLRDISALREADDAKTTFLATTSHELRTPLAIIGGFTEMLVHYDLDEATRATALDTILKQTRQLTRMVEGLLQTSQLERRGVRLHPQLLDPGAVVAERVDELRRTFDREIRLTARADLVAWADPLALATVVDHLVENAIKYSPGGGPVEVVVAPDGQAGDRVRLTVTDDGIGMDAATAARCFERFWQAEQGDDRRFPGTGVGLYLTRSLVEGMGGVVSVDSSPGKGSTFEVSLRTDPVPDVEEHRHVLPAQAGSLVDHVLRHAGVRTSA